VRLWLDVGAQVNVGACNLFQNNFIAFLSAAMDLKNDSNIFQGNTSVQLQ
jgi:hypothetical protein